MKFQCFKKKKKKNKYWKRALKTFVVIGPNKLSK
jgi:hypothetical protein